MYLLAETEDTLLTGFSGFLILLFIIWLGWRLFFRDR